MGNCQKEKLEESNLKTRIFEEIKLGSSYRVSSIINCFVQGLGIQVLDNLQYKHKKVTTNPLGLCLLLNKPDLFSKFIEAKSDPSTMERIFSITSFDSIEYLVQKNYSSMLKMYFPLYDSAINTQNSLADTYSVAFSQSFKFRSKVLMIHLATLRGHLEIVKFFHKFYENANPPPDYDIESLEENTGENCGLLACRYGHFELVKYLHTEAKCSFEILNYFKENALIVTLASMNKDPSSKFVDIFRYLLEVVKIGPVYMYEEAAVLAKSRPMYNLLSEHLKKVGIIIAVKEFDENSFLYSDPNDTSVHAATQQFFTDSFISASKRQSIRSALSSISSNECENDLKMSLLF